MPDLQFPLRLDHYYRVRKNLPPGLKAGEVVCILIMTYEPRGPKHSGWAITLKRAENDYIDVIVQLPKGRVKDYFEPYLENKKWKRRTD